MYKGALLECMNAYEKVQLNWYCLLLKIMENNGFKLVEEDAMLIYGDEEWIVPEFRLSNRGVEKLIEKSIDLECERSVQLTFEGYLLDVNVRIYVDIDKHYNRVVAV